MKIDNWKTQLRKGILEFHLMSLLRASDQYGAAILKAITDMGCPITDGTLYALLGRLTREGILSGRWITENTLGHPRKYYQLTPKGKKMLDEMKKEWDQLVSAVTKQWEESHE